MANPKPLAAQSAKPATERNVEAIARGVTDGFGVVAVRHDDSGNAIGITRRIEEVKLRPVFASPDLDGTTRGLGEARMPGNDVVQAFILQQPNGLAQPVEQVDGQG